MGKSISEKLMLLQKPHIPITSFRCLTQRKDIHCRVLPWPEVAPETLPHSFEPDSNLLLSFQLTKNQGLLLSPPSPSAKLTHDLKPWNLAAVGTGSCDVGGLKVRRHSDTSIQSKALKCTGDAKHWHSWSEKSPFGRDPRSPVQSASICTLLTLTHLSLAQRFQSSRILPSLVQGGTGQGQSCYPGGTAALQRAVAHCWNVVLSSLYIREIKLPFSDVTASFRLCFKASTLKETSKEEFP